MRILACGVPLALLLAGCAPRSMTGGAGGAAGGSGREAAAKPAPAARDTAAAAGATYRVEDELPENTPARPAELVGRIEPQKSDTIGVRDNPVEEASKVRYDIGYRIQIFASADRAAAEKVRERFIAETRLPTYIEYEDGLYKVRTGDFAERKDAAEARMKIAGAYPGSWIVRTTIRK